MDDKNEIIFRLHAIQAEINVLVALLEKKKVIGMNDFLSKTNEYIDTVLSFPEAELLDLGNFTDEIKKYLPKINHKKI